MCRWNKNIFLFFFLVSNIFLASFVLLFSFQIVKPVIIKTVSYPKNVQNVPGLQWGKGKLFILGGFFLSLQITFCFTLKSQFPINILTVTFTTHSQKMVQISTNKKKMLSFHITLDTNLQLFDFCLLFCLS